MEFTFSLLMMELRVMSKIGKTRETMTSICLFLPVDVIAEEKFELADEFF